MVLLARYKNSLPCNEDSGYLKKTTPCIKPKNIYFPPNNLATTMKLLVLQPREVCIASRVQRVCQLDLVAIFMPLKECSVQVENHAFFLWESKNFFTIILENWHF